MNFSSRICFLFIIRDYAINMIWSVVSIIVGFILLLWSADRFIQGAAALARQLGVSLFLIGLTVVAMGTSAPEMVVSVMASISGNPGIAIGNVLGSNIANIGLILGLTALILPIRFKAAILRKELPILFIVTVIAGICLYDEFLSQFDGVILVVTFAAVMWFLLRQRPQSDDVGLVAAEAEEIPLMTTSKALFWVVVGLSLLVIGSRLLVWGSASIARSLGVSDLVIGLTIVAVGTSLPELAASLTSVFKKHHDIALGNVVGSNLFNLLTVLPLPGLIKPGVVEADAVWRDYPIMLLVTVLLILMILFKRKIPSIGRVQGLVLLSLYLGYIGLLYHSLS